MQRAFRTWTLGALTMACGLGPAGTGASEARAQFVNVNVGVGRPIVGPVAPGFGYPGPGYYGPGFRHHRPYGPGFRHGYPGPRPLPAPYYGGPVVRSYSSYSYRSYVYGGYPGFGYPW